MKHDEVYAMVGERIRAAREQHGLTQEDLAAAIGLTRTSITNIERGRQRLLLHTLCDIAGILRIEPASLLPNLNDMTIASVSSSSPNDVDDLEHESLSEKEWEWIRSAITAPERQG